ncbi:hypothetical protein BC829DRAFT_150242 [Chytridium lagenaria]|nr:hypothetical protein BC829DRAFT_150242 [Chytridium lagenaria]
MIPLYIFVAITANAFIYKVEKSGKSILKYLYSITAYPVIFTAHLVVGTICMIISNIRNEGYLIEMRNLKGQERIFTEHSLLTGFFVGVFQVYCNMDYKAVFCVYDTCRPANSRAGDYGECNRGLKNCFELYGFYCILIASFAICSLKNHILYVMKQFGFALGQNLTWDTIGYILILRSPSHFIFYASLTATYSYNAVYRIGIALWTRRKAQRRVDNIDDIKDTEKQDSPAKDSDLSKPSDTAVSFSNQGAAVKDNDPNRHIGLNAFTSSTAEKEAFQSLNAKAVRRIKSLYVNLDGVSDGRGDLRRQTTKRKPLSPSLASVAQGYSSGVDGKGVLRDQTASKTHSPSDRGTIGDVSGKDGDGNIERGFSIRRKESIQLPATSPAVERLKIMLISDLYTKEVLGPAYGKKN